MGKIKRASVNGALTRVKSTINKNGRSHTRIRVKLNTNGIRVSDVTELKVNRNVIGLT